VLAPGAAYRLRSDQPVTVYQYNPLEYELQGQYSYSNDASILLPVNAWGEAYRVATWDHAISASFYAVVASADGTVVTLTPPATGSVVYAYGSSIAADGSGTVTLDQGDVLEVLTPGGATAGVTGTLVSASQPVQVLAGSAGAWVLDCCADHLEESMWPIGTLGNEYFVTPPTLGGSTAPIGEVVRIVATEDDTTLVYDPPHPGAPTTIPTAGAYVELDDDATDFKITASAKILVAQIMEGGSVLGGGDPSLTLAVPVLQYRRNYLFHSPVNYDANFVNVTAPTGALVTIDGSPVTGWTPIGGSGESIARVPLSNAGDGDHTITSAVPIGISVYGYGMFTSYWYPGGLDLARL
jgi:hypothetical protein